MDALDETEAPRPGPPRNDAAPRSDAIPRKGRGVGRVDEGAVPSLGCPAEDDEPEGCCEGSDMTTRRILLCKN